MPFLRSGKVIGLPEMPEPVTVLVAGNEITEYSVIELPFARGGTKLTIAEPALLKVTEPVLAIALTAVGIPWTPLVGIAIAEMPDGILVPSTFVAVTLN